MLEKPGLGWGNEPACIDRHSYGDDIDTIKMEEVSAALLQFNMMHLNPHLLGLGISKGRFCFSQNPEENVVYFS